jgi:thymidylate kinase
MGLQQRKIVVCLEGIVGAGKTTQIKKLYSHFYPICEVIPELNDISPMKELREELKKTGRMSNLSKEDVIKIAEARGQIHQKLLKKIDKPIILMDRGIYTGMVFESGGISMWEVEKISKGFGVVTPHICFGLYCTTEKVLERIDKRRIEVGKYDHRAPHENEGCINKTREKYFEIAKHRPLILIETSGGVDEIQDDIVRRIYNAKLL